jgi:hypothetical protein
MTSKKNNGKIVIIKSRAVIGVKKKIFALVLLFNINLYAALGSYLQFSTSTVEQRLGLGKRQQGNLQQNALLSLAL